ncbi:GNAT family N-acetyltransferase [Sebaldella termitidis]|uniref:GNAT family N-acetyltransferase n=1 Tax=Sebaldella termitidis TaxID=826 RepID=UPI003EBB10D4
MFINGRKYAFVKNYRENEKLRKEYNKLTEKTYGFDFETWYQEGYWGERHIPYTLFDRESAVSNVSVNKIKFSVLGEEKEYIQLGTVMTDKAYKKQGLSSYLIKRAIEDTKSESDLIYLFANKNVLDFYPKFGFRETKEYNYFKDINYVKTEAQIKKLDMNDIESKKFLYEKAKNSLSVSKVSMVNNSELIMFYCTSFMKNFVYYIENLDAVVIAEYDGNILHIYDIFSGRKIELRNIINIMSLAETEKAVLGFTPDEEGFQNSMQNDRDNVLFVYNREKVIFDYNRLKFPELSHT